MKRWIQLLDITTAPAAGSAGPTTLKLPQGFRYHQIDEYLKSGAGQKLAAGWDEYTLLLNDKPNRNRKFQQRSDLNGVMGADYETVNDNVGAEACVRHLFSQWYRKQYVAAEKYALDVPAGVRASIQYKALSTAAGPTAAFRALVEPLNELPLDAWNIARDNSGKPLVNADNAFIPVFVKEFTRAINVAGSYIDLFDITPSDLYQMLAFADPAVPGADPNTTISQITLKGDGDEFYKRTRTESDNDLIIHGMEPHSGYFIIHPDASDRPDEFWNLARYTNLQARIEFEAAPTAGSQIQMLSDRWGRME